MRRAILSTILLAFLPGTALAGPPVVVELYQSQGCSSCPPAIANVNLLADRADVLALTFAVTYWDQLGWKDTFAAKDFTARQYDYARGLHRANVYTPQVIIDGRADQTGTDNEQLRRAIAQAAPHAGPVLTRNGASVSVSASLGGGADVWLVRYDPRVLNVPIGAGENSGITIAHRNVVRSLVRLGGWTGAAQAYAIPQGGDPAWRAAILLQAKNGGSILSALKL